MYRVFGKHLNFGHNFCKCRPFLNVILLANSQRNPLRICYKGFKLSSATLLPYLVKLENLNYELLVVKLKKKTSQRSVLCIMTNVEDDRHLFLHKLSILIPIFCLSSSNFAFSLAKIKTKWPPIYFGHILKKTLYVSVVLIFFYFLSINDKGHK